jgi:hypothetical protein
MKSPYLSRISAILLGAPALVLLFAADDLLPALISSFAGRDAWLGQLVASGWLAIAMLNWLSRNTVIGGIHGRPLVLANLTVYVVIATTMWDATASTARPAVMLAGSGVAAVMAAAYGWLMMLGPLPADLPRVESPGGRH